MKLSDISAVLAIEQAAYRSVWSPKDFAYELQNNKFAHYFVLRVFYPGYTFNKDQEEVDANTSTIIGVGGFWLLADEAHINTVAIHPNWQRLGLGEWLLLTLLENSQQLGANIATLEVRPSNQRALLLYQKYDFHQVGQRPRYYNNDEDALILTASSLALPDYQTMLCQRRAILAQRLAKIDIDKIG